MAAKAQQGSDQRRTTKTRLRSFFLPGTIAARLHRNRSSISSPMSNSTLLTPTQRYAAGALLALALRQAQIHQSHLLDQFDGDGDRDPNNPAQDRISGVSSAIEGSDDCDDDGGSSRFWTHESHGLLRPVFRFLEIDQKAWPGLEETAVSSPGKHHIRAFLRIIFEEEGKMSKESEEQELALMKAVDAMAVNLEAESASNGMGEEKKHEPQCLGNSNSDCLQKKKETTSGSVLNSEVLFTRNRPLDLTEDLCTEKSDLMESPTNYQRKIAVLFELLSACLADVPQDDKKISRNRRGYDARHRVALRLLATWLDVKCIKVDSMEIIVACSAMAAVKGEEAPTEESIPEESKWSQWKRGGIIGAAALTGGTLLAITGGLAAPAIAAGFSALAPTLGTLVPVIGASGFGAAASAAGSVAGSVAVAASFGAAGAGLTGSKMARRIGSIEEFEFKAIGEITTKRLAVGILVSGFAFEEEDFMRPWQGIEDNLERYALLWESKNIIAVSTAIQDWLTSRLTLELMKQGAMMTVLSTLVTALAWPATLLAATDFIDSKWSIAIDRSDKAGKLLAEVLLKGLQGNRPVTLVGFSLGARVIFKCLQELVESGDNEGIVERVVLFGAPVSHKGEDWESARKMVAGRFVNVYSTNDWILGLTFRASLLSQGLAGIQAIDVPGIENVDATHLVDSHSSYLWNVHRILQQFELDTYYPVFLSAP